MIFLKFKYPIDNAEYEVDTNAQRDKVADLIGDFLHSQVGAGEDKSKPNEHKVFEIELKIDLSDDTWYVTDNCGNKGLRDGILMDILRRESE